VRALRLDHGIETYGYRLEEHDGRTMLPEELAKRGVKGPVIKELIKHGEITVDGNLVKLDDVSLFKRGQSFAMVMDTRLTDNCFELAKGVDMLLCESTYLDSEEREAKAHGHMTARQAGIIAREAGVRKLVLTHFSQRYGSTKPFVEEARQEFDGEVIAVRDCDRVSVPKRPGSEGEDEP
jgi:ribonuclease Z